MELSLPEMGNMGYRVGLGEKIKVSIYFSLCPLLLPSLLTTYSNSFYCSSYCAFLNPCLKTAAENHWSFGHW